MVEILRMKKQRGCENYLKTIYHDIQHAGSYSGIDKLYRAVKDEGCYRLTRKQIQEWLKTQDAYGLHHSVQRRFKRNRVVVGGIDQQWDIDLAVMSDLSQENDGYRYFLLAIDILSRYVWAEPMKSKRGRDVISVMRRIFQSGRKPEKIRTDAGKEFLDKEVQQFSKVTV